jgi:hypothetical protein
MTEDQADDLRKILKYGILTPGERHDIERRLEWDWDESDDHQKILAEHAYALDRARREANRT